MAISIEEQIQKSVCYGVAYDATIKECKRCDAAQRCSARCQELYYTANTDSVPGQKNLEKMLSKSSLVSTKINMPPEVIELNVQTPQHVENTGKSSSRTKKSAGPKEKKPAKTEKSYDKDMPVLKNYSIDELKKLAVKRKCPNLEDLEKIASPQIQRMRYIMLIKATYEI